jgi:large-conductance mechanosensitive channel
MNERYQGDGPQGKTRKSAAKLKPKTQAAASVRVESRPTNKQERKAARRRREAEEKKKAEERTRKQAEREKVAKIAAGEEGEKPKKPGLLGSFSKILPPKPTAPAAAADGAATAGPKPSAFPVTQEYKRWRKVYWVLLGIGIFFVAISFMTQMNFPEQIMLWGPLMAAAYVFIIAALVLDFAKIRPMVKKHQKELGTSARKSPKQIKHEQEAAERAREIEEYNKAKKQARKFKNRQMLGIKYEPKLSGEESAEQEPADVADAAAAATPASAAKEAASAHDDTRDEAASTPFTPDETIQTCTIEAENFEPSLKRAIEDEEKVIRFEDQWDDIEDDDDRRRRPRV